MEGLLGVKERQEREREAVSRSILDAARDLFVAEGYHNVSIRKIAERIEYSPAAIYGYFPSKDDIFFALAEEGFRTLLAMPRGQGRRARDLKATANAFWRVYEFSISTPGGLRVDVRRPDRAADQQGLASALVFVHEMKARLGARTSRAIDAGSFSCRDRAGRGVPHPAHRHPRRRVSAGCATVGHAGRGPRRPLRTTRSKR